MQPITSAFNSLLQGSVDVDDNDIPITRLAHNDEWEALDAAMKEMK
jgi:hypothetical protein